MDRHGDLRVSDRVRVGDGIGKLKTGVEAVIVQGPMTVGMISGVYIVRADNGEEEQLHESRLRPASRVRQVWSSLAIRSAVLARKEMLG
jgi:hypothetical protein